MKMPVKLTVVGVALLLLVMLGAPSEAWAQESWFVSFENNLVTPVKRTDTNRLVEVGVVESDGFSELALSLGGEFKEKMPTTGAVGALLVPDTEVFQYLFRSEGRILFPLEVKAEMAKQSGAIFVSEPRRVPVAFPRYRVYLYNETSAGAVVSVSVYRSR